MKAAKVAQNPGPPAGQPPANPITGSQGPNLQPDNNASLGEKTSRFFTDPGGLQSMLGVVGHEGRENLASSMPMAGAVAGGLAGGAGAIPGAALGSIAKQLISSKKDTSPEDTGLDIAKDVGLNALLPAAVSKIPFIGKLVGKLAGRDNPEIQKFIEKGAGRFTDYPESSLVETAASNARGTGLMPTSEIGSNNVVTDLLKVPYNQVGQESTAISKVADKALSSVEQVRNWKLATGDSTISQLGAKRATAAGFNGEKFDPSKVLDELNGPKKDVYNEAISPEVRQNMTDFMEKVKTLQPPEAKGFMPGLIRYSQHRLIFHGLGAITGGMAGSGGGAVTALAGSAGGIILSEVAISKITGSPMLGRLAIQALETPAGSPQAQLMSKALLYGMRGTAVMLQMPDGTKEKGEIDDKGNITTPHPTVPMTLLHKPAESYQAQ